LTIYFVTSPAGLAYEGATLLQTFGDHREATERFLYLRTATVPFPAEAYRFSTDYTGKGLRLARYEYRAPNGSGAPCKYGSKDMRPSWTFVLLKRRDWPALMVAEIERVLMKHGICVACEAMPTGRDGRASFCPAHRGAP
jgi:hypothetical protein